MAVRLSALSASWPLPPRRFLVLISVRGWVDPRAIVLLEGLGKLKKSSNFIGNRTCDLPVCNIEPQPTTLPCAPQTLIITAAKLIYLQTELNSVSRGCILRTAYFCIQLSLCKLIQTAIGTIMFLFWLRIFWRKWELSSELTDLLVTSTLLSRLTTSLSVTLL
jgi:hypothetical protein